MVEVYIAFWHTIREILFVSKDKNDCVPHFPVIDDSVELLPSLINSVAISTVNYKDETLGTCVIVTPQWTDFILTSYILKQDLIII